jgi:hypothetical protein
MLISPLISSTNMPESTDHMEFSQPHSVKPETPMTNPPNDTVASQKPMPSDLLERPWTHPPTRISFRGPDHDDSTYVVLCGLRTVLARLLIWFNLPLCWFVGITVATRYIEQWLKAHYSGTRSTAVIVFVVIYVVYAVLAHTVAVFGGIGWELWWNPYARAPTLRGEVGKEEEVAMVKRNRLMARRMGRKFLTCLG